MLQDHWVGGLTRGEARSACLPTREPSSPRSREAVAPTTFFDILARSVPQPSVSGSRRRWTVWSSFRCETDTVLKHRIIILFVFTPRAQREQRTNV